MFRFMRKEGMYYMGILSFLFEPFVFYVLLAILVFGAIYIIFSTLGKNAEVHPADQGHGLDMQFLEIDAHKSDQENAEIKKALSSKEEELLICSREKDKQLEENERLRSSIAALEAQLKEKLGSLKEENSDRQGLQDRIKTLEKELADLKTDLSLKSQMYNGLKSQYEELEQSMMRSSTPKQETQTKPPAKEKDLLSRIENPEEEEKKEG
jgi:chromosome segregation ATPase